MHSIQPQNIDRVVVRTPNWVGDAVMCVPALRELKRIYPSAHITLVARPGAPDIFIDADFADEVIIYERAGLASVWQQISDWKKRRFDLAILFQNAFEAAAISFLARVPVRVGYDSEHRGFLLTHSIPLPTWKDQRHEVFYYLNIIHELERAISGTSSPETVEPEFALSVSEDRKLQARKLLREQGLDDTKPLVLLCPGSVNSRAKRWPAERFAALADQFSAAATNVALIGSPGETDVSEKVRDLAQAKLLVLTGQTSMAEATALISIADVLITNDTGPAHIGPAVGTPTLVIFGPTNPATTRPFGPAGVVVREPPDCAPCMLRDCPIDHRCMTAIAPADIFARARKLMRRGMEVIA